MLLAVNVNPSVDRVWHIPGFEAGKAFRVERTWLGAGGKGCNVARVAAALGAQVAATGFIAGAAGSFVEADLSRHGVGTAFYQLASGETRTCPTIVDPRTGRVTEIREAGPTLNGTEAESFLAHFQTLLGEGVPESSGELGPALPSVVTLSGSLLPGLDTGFYAGLIRTAAEVRVPCILDTSGEALRRGLVAAPWAVKVNREELLGLGEPREGVDGGHSEASLAKRLLSVVRSGVTLAVVTLGREGLLAYDGDALWQATLPGVLDVVQPVGSGDAATAALAVTLNGWLAKGILSAAAWPDLGFANLPKATRSGLTREAVRAMVAAGAANAVTEGIGTCPPPVFRRLQDRVKVEVSHLE